MSSLIAVLRIRPLLEEALVLLDSDNPECQTKIIQRFLDSLPPTLPNPRGWGPSFVKPDLTKDDFVTWLQTVDMFPDWMAFYTAERAALVLKIREELQREGTA